MKKIVLVTGGSRGLGKSMALALANKGMDVVITYQSQQASALDVVASIQKTGNKASALQLDVSDSRSFKQFTAALSQVLKNEYQREDFDYLVNNAGIGINAPFTQTTEDQFDQLVSIHLKGAFFLTQSLLPLMRDGGKILNVSSGLARFSLPGYAAYAMMKGGIEVMTRYLAKELGERGIQVNCIAPGAIETDFGGGAVRDNASINQYIANETALGRAGLPDDIGAVVSMMLSNDANWINAQRIEISGGIFI
ncbi:MAG: NAD(P)-dependent dehydrogenase (short-subunit alcohol dehydrogenase family) [Oceanicoccus sp.]|jgi:NAD(P)-dependent dehydrogenase (short-subunit alcohol dehydrogenase family)